MIPNDLIGFGIEKLPKGIDISLPIDILHLSEFMTKIKLDKLKIDDDRELIEKVKIIITRLLKDIDQIEDDIEI